MLLICLYADAQAHRPFDLERGPVFRARVLHCGGGGGGEARTVLYLLAAHIAVDGWSMDVLVDELGKIAALLAARRSGGRAPECVHSSAVCVCGWFCSENRLHIHSRVLRCRRWRRKWWRG